MYGDLPPEEVLQFHYRVMNFDEEPLNRLRQTGLNTRSDVKHAVTQAFKAQVPGIVLSREYCDMKLDNLSAVGEAIRELGLKT